MNHQQEVHQFDDTHFGEINLAQHIVMVVVGDNIVCIGLYGTINKLIVIRVGCYKVEMIVGCEEHRVWICHDIVYNRLGKLWSEKQPQDFIVFHKNLVGYAKIITSQHDRRPYGTINAVLADALYNAICVKNNAHDGLTGKFLFLLTEPLMQIHFVNFVKAFLVQFARLPHLLSHFVEFLGKIVGDKLLDVVQLLVALDGRKNIKQIELCGIEYSRLYTFHNNIYLQFCCKDTK